MKSFLCLLLSSTFLNFVSFPIQSTEKHFIPSKSHTRSDLHNALMFVMPRYTTGFHFLRRAAAAVLLLCCETGDVCVCAEAQ